MSEVTDDWSYRGLRAVILQNEKLRVSVFPEVGARVFDIIHVPSQTNVLWHNPRIPLRRAPFGSRFDDYWAGGWDEVFPNDQESVVGGEKFPDMGEVWSIPWEYQTNEVGGSASVTTTVTTPISPARISRTLTLAKGSSKLTADYEIQNLSGDEMKFIWKVHAAFAINDHCSIIAGPARAVIDPRFRQLFDAADYPWPFAPMTGGVKRDMSRVRTTDHDCTCQYLTELAGKTVGFRDELNGVESRMTFSGALDNVWLFLSYGGWRGNYVAAIEPSTGYPHDLAEAIRQGHCSTLEGNGRLSARLEFSVDAIPRRQGSNL